MVQRKHELHLKDMFLTNWTVLRIVCLVILVSWVLFRIVVLEAANYIIVLYAVHSSRCHLPSRVDERRPKGAGCPPIALPALSYPPSTAWSSGGATRGRHKSAR